MAQCHGTVTVMYCLCIGVCVHLFQTTALQEGTAAARRVCQGLVDLEKLALAWYRTRTRCSPVALITRSCRRRINAGIKKKKTVVQQFIE